MILFRCVRVKGVAGGHVQIQLSCDWSCKILMKYIEVWGVNVETLKRRKYFGKFVCLTSIKKDI